MTVVTKAGDCETGPIEFHFQEIFGGEGIDIVAGDAVRTRVFPKTRFQTGLAHIETLEFCNGEEVALRIEELRASTTVTIDIARPYVVVTLMDGRLRADSRASSPGYI